MNARPVIKVAVVSVALGIAVMICAVMIISGFKRNILEKLTGFSGHLHITSFDNNNSYEEEPIPFDTLMMHQLQNSSEVKHVQVYATKAGIIKYKDEFQGALIKGVNQTLDTSFFAKRLVRGTFPNFSGIEKSNDVLISLNTATLLNLDVDSSFLVYFIQDPPRYRKFRVRGIYETGLGEFDELYLLADIRHIQKLNDWNENQIGGYEVFIHNFKNLNQVNTAIYKNIGYEYNCKSIAELYPQVFNWLELQNINVFVIIILMVIVAGINMISTLLILMLEQTNLIGILKALGAGNKAIKKIFIIVGSYLTLAGIFLGNVIAIGLGLAQQKYSLLKLPQESYYMSEVPVYFDIPSLLLLNTGTFIICILALLIPARFVTKIKPVSAIQFN